MTTNYHTPKGFDVFRECDGYWRAVDRREGNTPYNWAPYNCRTKREALEAVRQQLEQERIVEDCEAGNA